MAHKTTFKTKMKRRQKGKTDYKKRLGLIKGNKPRVVIRVSNKKIVSQIIEYEPKGDKTLINATSLELKKYGYKGHNGNKTASYLTGYLCGKKAIKKGIKTANPDIGLKTPIHKSNIFAAVKGLIDSGIEMKYDKKALPEVTNVDNIKAEIDKKY